MIVIRVCWRSQWHTLHTRSRAQCAQVTHSEITSTSRLGDHWRPSNIHKFHKVTIFKYIFRSTSRNLSNSSLPNSSKMVEVQQQHQQSVAPQVADLDAPSRQIFGNSLQELFPRSLNTEHLTSTASGLQTFFDLYFRPFENAMIFSLQSSHNH